MRHRWLSRHNWSVEASIQQASYTRTEQDGESITSADRNKWAQTPPMGIL